VKILRTCKFQIGNNDMKHTAILQPQLGVDDLTFSWKPEMENETNILKIVTRKCCDTQLQNVLRAVHGFV
jgi:hypothetical protein